MEERSVMNIMDIGKHIGIILAVSAAIIFLAGCSII